MVHEHDRVAEIVSDFFLNTCQLRRRLNMDDVMVVSDSSRIVDHSYVSSEFYGIPQATGSVAEFYIQPMLSCVGDVDIMYHFSSLLAIPQGHPPPTQLPDDFHRRVYVYELLTAGSQDMCI